MKKEIFQMERNKAPRMDGFLAEFYQNSREVISLDLSEFFAFLHARQIDLVRLDFGEIMLLPKINNAERIQ